VYWCAVCQTALAEAEVEYEDHASPSVTVKFPAVSDFGALPGAQEQEGLRPDLDHTPWTFRPTWPSLFTRLYLRGGGADGEVWILAEALLEQVMAQAKKKAYKVLEKFPARRWRVEVPPSFPGPGIPSHPRHLHHPGYGHRMRSYRSRHGQEDYESGLEYNLPIYSPVDDQGRFTPEVKFFAGSMSSTPTTQSSINSGKRAR